MGTEEPSCEKSGSSHEGVTVLAGKSVQRNSVGMDAGIWQIHPLHSAQLVPSRSNGQQFTAVYILP